MDTFYDVVLSSFFVAAGKAGRRWKEGKEGERKGDTLLVTSGQSI